MFNSLNLQFTYEYESENKEEYLGTEFFLKAIIKLYMQYFQKLHPTLKITFSEENYTYKLLQYEMSYFCNNQYFMISTCKSSSLLVLSYALNEDKQLFFCHNE